MLDASRCEQEQRVDQEDRGLKRVKKRYWARVILCFHAGRLLTDL